jgi:hypothetical protein
MRLDVKFRTLCLAGVGIVAVLAAGEVLARGGGRSAGGHWIGGGSHGQHWGGGVHGGRVAHGGGRRTADFGRYWRRDHGSGGSYWGGYYGGGGVYYDDVGNYDDYAPDGPPAYGGAPIHAPNYSPAPGYQAPIVVYPPVVYQSYAPVASYGSDPHIIYLPATRHRRARKSCNCRSE